MIIKDSSTGLGIPYANWEIFNNAGTSVAAGEADGAGNVSNGIFQGYSANDTVKFSAAGYTGNDATADVIAGADMVNLLENSMLPTFVITAVKKAKENPLTLLLIIAVIAVIIWKRKAIMSLVK